MVSRIAGVRHCAISVPVQFGPLHNCNRWLVTPALLSRQYGVADRTPIVAQMLGEAGSWVA